MDYFKVFLGIFVDALIATSLHKCLGWLRILYECCRLEIETRGKSLAVNPVSIYLEMKKLKPTKLQVGGA